MNIGEALLFALKDAGARALFGIPGDYVLPFFDVIEKSHILPLYTLCHEPAVGYAADAAGRHGGGIGVAVVTYGAGALSMMNAVACAWAEKSPLVVISGAPGREEFDQGLLLHHQIRHAGSQMHIFEELTCARTILNDPLKAPKEIARVLRACRRHSRPVYIELPRDVVHEPCQAVRDLHEASHDKTAVALCAEAIVQKVAKAKNPVILAGVEVRRFGQEEAVAALALKTRIPLVTTFMGKGMFTKYASTCLGAYIGKAGDARLRDLVEDSDFLIMLGVIISDTNFGHAGKKIDLSCAIRANEEAVFVGEKRFDNVDIPELVRALQKLLPRNVPRHLSPVPREGAPAGDHLLRADDIAGILNAALAGFPRMPLAADVGDCLFVATGVRDVPFLASGYYATMGFGVPAGLGIQAATGERPLIVVGDGGFQMTGWELLNCVNNGLDPVVLVLNNSGWGMLKQFHPKAGYTTRNSISYAAMAEVLGGVGYKAATPQELSKALHSALQQRGRFQLIEVILPGNEISSMLKRYIEALKSKAAAEVMPDRNKQLCACSEKS